MEDVKKLEDKVVDVLKTIFDPEIPVNIYELGLVYKVKVEETDQVQIKMTLTSPNCPVAESLPIEVESKVNSMDGVSQASVEIVWEPPWNPEMMSEAAKLELGLL
jgi:FeS assembly SUF system protein